MVVNRKPTGRALSIPAGLSIGAAAALAWTLLTAMLMARMVESEVLAESAIGYGSGVILLTASFLSAMVAYRRVKRQRAMVCMISGGLYFLMLLAITALFFGGQYTGVGVTAIVIAAGAGCAVLLGLRDGRGKRKGRYKPPKR